MSACAEIKLKKNIIAVPSMLPDEVEIGDIYEDTNGDLTMDVFVGPAIKSEK